MAEARSEVMPLYGFLHGDTLGLVILAYPGDTIEELGGKLQAAAGVRVAPRQGMSVVFKGRTLDPKERISAVGLKPLDRFDVVPREGA